MQIRDIKTFPTWVGSRNQLIVKVETDEGLVGWGEAGSGRELAVVGAIKHYRESIGVTAEWLTRLRAAVGPAPDLGIDYHHRLSVPEAASFCQRTPSGMLDFLEESIRAENAEAHARRCAA